MKIRTDSTSTALPQECASKSARGGYIDEVMNATLSRNGVFLVAGFGLLLWTLGMFWPMPKKADLLTPVLGVWPGSETLIVARERGVLPEAWINFVEMSWSSAAMLAYEKRVVDAAVVTLDELLRLKAAGQKPKAILVMGVSKGGDAIMARPPISSLADLRGKRVGVEVRAVGEYLLARGLAEVGMTMKDVIVVPINSAETDDAYEDMALDAIVASEPALARLTDKGARVLFDSSGLGDEITRVLMVREDVLETYRTELQAMVAAHFGTSLTAVADGGPSEELALILRREGVTQEQFRSALALTWMPDKKENLKMLTPGPDSLRPVLERMGAFMMTHGLIKRPVDAGKALDPSFMKEGQ